MEDLEDLFDRPGLRFFLNNHPQSPVIKNTKLIDSSNFDKYVPINFGLVNPNQNWRLSKFLDASIFGDIPLNNNQIDILSDTIDWDIVSHKELSGPIIIKHKNKINWEIFLQNGHPKDINSLINVGDKIIEHQYLFFNPRMKKMYYNIPFILVFPNLIDWNWLVKNVKLNEFILLKFWNNFKSNDISRYQTITPKIAKQKLRSINWIIAGKHPLQEEVIHIAHDYLTWETICKRQKKMSEETLIKFSHKLHWKNVSTYQKLSCSFIKKYYKKLDMRLVSQFQNLSIDLIKELEEFIYFDLLAVNKNFNQQGTIQVLTNGTNYFIIDPPPIGNIPSVSYYNANWV